MPAKSVKRLLLALLLLGGLATGILAIIAGVGQKIDELSPEELKREQKERHALARAETLFAAAEYDSAIRAFKGVIADYRKGYYNDKAQLRIGDCFLEKKDFRMARTAYMLFISNNPSSPHVADAYYRIGESFIRAGEPENALNAYTFAFNNYPEHELGEKTLFWIAEWYEDLADYGNAVYHYKKLVDWFPDNAFTDKALYRLARIHQRLQKPDRVRHYARRLLKEFPVSTLVPEAYIIISDTYLHRSDVARREELLREALARRPLDRGIYRRLADMHRDLRLWQRAADLYLVAVKPVYTDPYAPRNLAAGTGDTVVAAPLPAIDTTFLADTLNRYCYRRYLTCRLAAGDTALFRKGGDMFLRNVRDRTDRNSICAAFADLHYGAGEYEQALQFYTAVMPETGLTLLQRYRMAMCYTRLQAYRQSVAVYRGLLRAYADAADELKVTVDESMARLALAEALFDGERYVEAVAQYRLVQGLDRDFIALRTAQCYRRMDMRPEAGDVLKQIAERYPHRLLTEGDPVVYTDSTWQTSYLAYLGRVVGGAPFK